MNNSRAQGFSPRWIVLSLGVIVLAGVFIRLGFWQLDRLSQRKAENARLESRMAAPVFVLSGSSGPVDAAALEFRTVSVTGQYDFDHQVALASRTYNGQLGIDLLTPLMVQGSREAVLVDRGWIPVSDLQRSAWVKYNQPGQVTLKGMVLASQIGAGPSIPVTGSSTAQQDLWSSPVVQRIQNQVPEKLIPFYIQEIPDPDRTSLPYIRDPQIDLSNGPHLGYAIEWFSFAAVVLVGYPFWIRRQLRHRRSGQSEIPKDGSVRESGNDQEAEY